VAVSKKKLYAIVTQNNIKEKLEQNLDQVIDKIQVKLLSMLNL
jgi:predicted transcriptional regulator